MYCYWDHRNCIVRSDSSGSVDNAFTWVSARLFSFALLAGSSTISWIADSRPADLAEWVRILGIQTVRDAIDFKVTVSLMSEQPRSKDAVEVATTDFYFKSARICIANWIMKGV